MIVKNKYSMHEEFSAARSGRTVRGISRSALAIAVSGILLAGLGGCAAVTNDEVDTAPAEQTAQPTAAQPTAAPPAGCSSELALDSGDVVGLEDVTDEFGTYCHTTISPTSEAAVYDSTKTDFETLAEFGFTEDDAVEALPVALRILTEEVLDSSRLDNYSIAPAEWFAANSGYMTAELQPQFQAALDDDGTKLNTAGVIVTDILPSPLARDGGARASGTVVRLDRIYGEQPDGGQANLVFSIASTSTYVVTDAQIVALVLVADPNQIEDALRASNPELFDGAENSFLTMTGNTVLGFGLDSNEQIIGTNSNIQLYTDQSLDVIA
ncbi:hypothetical protein E3T46_07240 [Cryobacterium sp. Hh11]|uniref:hypothetical protein n=1 Tax=Cryobacterium sp. Hh11 TaxID=2555868 RepID=UPI00106AA8E1|nr:hypothetical protein [Cryobacterium sp. Hh11]TFD52087.1 hypothetical protein E3T46_07240 [Cryobacterium sp. Hh11]